MNEEAIIQALADYKVISFAGLHYQICTAFIGETDDKQFVAACHYHINVSPLYGTVNSRMEFETIQCETEEQASEYLVKMIDDVLRIGGGDNNQEGVS